MAGYFLSNLFFLYYGLSSKPKKFLNELSIPTLADLDFIQLLVLLSHFIYQKPPIEFNLFLFKKVAISDVLD